MIEVFAQNVEAEVVVFDYDPGHEQALVAAIQAHRPRLIYALGGAAVDMVGRHFPDTPLCFSMVMAHRQNVLNKIPKAMGVSLETPVLVEFSKFKLVLPTLSKVLVFHSAPLTESVADTKRQLALLGIELIAVRVDHEDDIPAAYAANQVQIDAIWLQNDPVVMTTKTFNFLREKSLADRTPLITSLSSVLAKQGALASVSVDFANTAAQAASMATMVLQHGADPATIGVHSPIGGELAVNLDVAKALGLTIAPDVVPLISQLISTDPDT
jgi:ABC-type uncharacterized transport system substrate-binding protein